MRRKVTLNLDERFIEAMDQERGLVARSRWIERPWSPITGDPAGARKLKAERPDLPDAVVAEKLAAAHVEERYVSPFKGPGAKSSNLSDLTP